MTLKKGEGNKSLHVWNNGEKYIISFALFCFGKIKKYDRPSPTGSGAMTSAKISKQTQKKLYDR